MNGGDQFFELIEDNRARLRWKLWLLADGLALQSDDGAAVFEVPKTNAPEKVRLLEFPAVTPILSIKTDKTHNFKLTPEAAAAARDWIGPLTDEHLKVALKQRRWIEITTALLILSMSLPRSRNPFQGFDPAFLFLGAVLLGAVLMGAVRPHRILFLIDSFCLLMIAILWAYEVALGERFWIWAAGVVSHSILSLVAFMEFRGFRSVNADRLQPDPEKTWQKNL